MLKIPKNISVNISIAISIILFGAVLVGIFLMPAFVSVLLQIPDQIGSRGEISEPEKIFVLILAYIVLSIIALANFLLFRLLLRVKMGEVFTAKSISLIRGVSWSCFALAIVFLILGLYFTISPIVAFLAVFLGFSLRVVKNVLEEATEIKSENDLTV